MKKLLSILLAMAMLMAFAVPAIATETTTEPSTGTAYDIQITSDIVIDERIHDSNGYYPWDRYGKLDAIVAGKELKGITVVEFHNAVNEAYGDLTMSLGVDPELDNTWTVGCTHTGSISFYRSQQETHEDILVFNTHVKITVQETRIASITAEPITVFAGGFTDQHEYFATIIYKDGSTEKIDMSYWDPLPTEVGTYTKTAYVYDYVEIPVTIQVIPFSADIQITSDIIIDAGIHDNGHYLWNFYGKVDATVAGKEFKGISLENLLSAVEEVYGPCDDYICNDDQYETPWALNSTHEGTIGFYQWSENAHDYVTLFAAHVNITVQEIIDSITAEPISYYEGGFAIPNDYYAVATYKDGSTEKVPLCYHGEWPTEVGTYTKIAYAFGYIEVPVAIEVEPSPLDIQITSDIVIDGMIHYADGYYPWDSYGKVDAIVAGKEFTGISLDELRLAVNEVYGDYGMSRYANQEDAPWTVGSTHEGTLRFYLWPEGGEYTPICEIPVKITVQETNIASITTEPITIYEGGLGKHECFAVVTYKNGTTEEVPMYLQGEYPTEIGTYEKTASVYGCIEVPVTVKVVPYPTSGQCGDHMTWTYDAAAKKLTISGTGAMYQIAENFVDVLNGEYLYNPEFWHYRDVQDIVVEEGVEYLSDFAFLAFQETTLQLPSTLKEIPKRMLTWSEKMSSLVIPEGITSLTGYPFESTAVEELYLPGTLTEADMLTLCFIGIDRNQESGLALKKIHFAGTEDQWNAIKWVRSAIFAELFGNDEAYEEMYNTYKEPFANVEILFEPKAEITVEDGVAAVPDSAVEVTEGEDVVIDVTGTEEKADSVVIGAETVDKIAAAEAPVEVKLPDASVAFDKTAIGSINEQAGEAPVTIVAQKVAESTLNAQQTAALDKTEVCAVLTLEAYAGETKITDFGGGKVTISIPFALPEGKEGKDFYVAYVADDGTVTAMPTTYADGKLTFETTHFSSYVVVDKSAAAEVTPGNPQTGDSSHILLFTVLMLMSAAALAVCTTKRRTF